MFRVLTKVAIVCSVLREFGVIVWCRASMRTVLLGLLPAVVASPVKGGQHAADHEEDEHWRGRHGVETVP